MKPEMSYIILEQIWEADGEDPAENQIVPILEDLLSFEIDHVGVPEDWAKIHTLKPGFYKVSFETEHQKDYCDGYLEAEYMTVGALVSIEPSPVVARWHWYTLRAQSRILDLYRPLRKVWHIDFDYGGAGVCTGPCWLPRALWHRFLRREGPWGKEIGRRLY
jgi:hypothetical protein